MTTPKNLPASVKARLLAMAERRGESFNLLAGAFRRRAATLSS
jgi:hypothetical protein